jgi:hypothetical protein
MDMDIWAGRHEHEDMDMDMNRRRPVSIILRRCYVRNQQKLWRHGHGDMEMVTWTLRHCQGDMDMDKETGACRHGHEDV